MCYLHLFLPKSTIIFCKVSDNGGRKPTKIMGKMLKFTISYINGRKREYNKGRTAHCGNGVQTLMVSLEKRKASEERGEY